MKQFFWATITSCMFFLGSSTIAPIFGQRLHIAPDVDTIYICPDSSLVLTAKGGSGYVWTSPTISIANPASDTLRLKSPASGTLIILSGSVNGVSQRDSLRILTAVPALTLQAIDPNAGVCRGVPVRLRASTNTRGYGLRFQPTEGIIPTDDPEVFVALPKATTNYTAILNLGGCETRKSITVTILPPRVDILSADTVQLCLGTPLKIGAITNTTNATGLYWSASDGSFRDSLKLTVDVNPRKSVTYYTRFVSGGCTILDSVFVKVDSLPINRSISADPLKNPYCQGQIVTLKSETFEPYLYPNIKHTWFPSKGFETPDTLWNMVITTQDSTIYFRETRNGACIDTQGVFIPVIRPKNIQITPPNPEICLGENVQLNASFEGEGEIKWSPESNISCVECKNPRVVPNTTTTYTITVTEKGCPTSKSVTVNVLQPPATPIAVNPTICLGDSLALFLSSPEPGVTYNWVSPQIPSLNVAGALLKVGPKTNTTYTLTAQRGRCPAVQVQTTVYVVQPADLTVPITQVLCPGQNISLQVDGTAPSGVQESFLWSWNNGLNTASGPTLSVNNLTKSTQFKVTYIYGPNCGTITKTIQVDVETVPVITGFTYDPPEAVVDGIPQGSNITIRANTNPPNPAGVTYSWKANGTPLQGSSNTIQEKPTEDPTVYMVTIKTAKGCEVVAVTPPIRVVPPEFDLPSAFTPNGDDHNDHFRVVFTGNIEILEFRVWNRWGQVVFNSVNPQGWDGNVGGNPAPSDVYVYKVVLRFPDGKEFNRQGDVTLIR